MPEIELGASPLAIIEFKASDDMASSLTFDEESREVSFDGKTYLVSHSQTGTFKSISIDLVDSDGRRSTYTQTLIVHQAQQVEENKEGTSQDREDDNTGQSEEIAEVEQSVLAHSPE